MGVKKDKPRNGGTMTEAAFWGMIRSALRAKSRWWKPRQNALLEARRHYSGVNKAQKWEYMCAFCGKWFMQKEVEVDHVVSAGSLTCGDDLKGFVERLFSEGGWRVLCKKCHKDRTTSERMLKKKG